MSSATQSKQKTATKPPNTTKSESLAPLLRHFVGIDIIVETKQGRTFRGRLREADAYMNLVLSRTTSKTTKGNTQVPAGSPSDGTPSGLEFDLVHIRGPSIRYIVFGANVDIVGVIKAGRDRERAAGDKYRRGIRKARK